jgi:hypothetical protein
VAAAVDPAVEDEYWQVNYRTRPYVTSGADYSTYRDAYRYGWESRANRTGTWADAQNDLERNWDKAKATSKLGWSDAKEAVRDGWHRVERAMPGDADGDGR